MNNKEALSSYKTILNDQDPAIKYSGAWVCSFNVDYFAKGVHFTVEAGACASFVFYGTEFKWFGGNSEKGGKANIFVDDNEPLTISQKGSYSPQVCLYQSEKMENHLHTVKIECLGGRIDIDRIEYTIMQSRTVDISPVGLSLPDSNIRLTEDSIINAGTLEIRDVPDTLDLQDRAELAVNVMTGLMGSDRAYAVAQSNYVRNMPESFNPHLYLITPKFIRMLPMMRKICGNVKNIDIETGAMRTALEHITESGQLRYPYDDGDAYKLNTSYPNVNAMFIFAIAEWKKRDPSNSDWDKWIKLLCEGLKKTIIKVPGADGIIYGFIPPECSFGEDGIWQFRQQTPGVPYAAPDEPVFDNQGCEGTTKWEMSNPLKALVCVYELYGDTESLGLASLLVNYMSKSNLWDYSDPKSHVDSNPIYISGHTHGNATVLQALLSYAIAAKDKKLMEKVRESYEEVIFDPNPDHGSVELGYFPCGKPDHQPGKANENRILWFR